MKLAIAIWLGLSPVARWTLIGWGVRPSTMTIGHWKAVRGIR